MENFVPIVFLFCAMSCLSLLRLEVVFDARGKAIERIYEIRGEQIESGKWPDIDYSIVGGDYVMQMLSLHKWTFKQFYPELAD